MNSVGRFDRFQLDLNILKHIRVGCNRLSDLKGLDSLNNVDKSLQRLRKSKFVSWNRKDGWRII